MLDDEAAQVVVTVAFAKVLEKNSTAREGARANTAPPAALLAPEVHDPDEVVEFDCKKEQLWTRKTDETPIAEAKLRALFSGNDEVQ